MVSSDRRAAQSPYRILRLEVRVLVPLADSNVTDVHASHYPWIRGRFHNFFLRRFLIHRNGLKEAIFHSGTGCLADDR